MSNSLLAISRQNIDIWLTFYLDIVDEQLLSKWRGLLSETERCQEQRFHFADDRKRYLVTRTLVRTVLSRYAAVAPADWEFSANAYGRPEIASRHGEALGLCFNVSHTHGLIALGVTRQRALGVDVENLQTRQMPLGIAEHFFSPTEATELAAVPQEMRQERFFEYWTLKESYIKARGMGLSIPLDRFRFYFPRAGAVQIAMNPELGDDENHWSFWQFRPVPYYLLTVCAERQEREVPLLTMRKITPTIADEPLAAVLLRTSEALLDRSKC